MTQIHEDSVTEEHRTSHHRSLLKYVRLPIPRAPGGMEHSEVAKRTTKKLRPLFLAAVILFSITGVGLHVVGGLVLLKTGLNGLALQGSLAYVAIGLFAVVAVFKLTHVVGAMHRKEKKEGTGED